MIYNMFWVFPFPHKSCLNMCKIQSVESKYLLLRTLYFKTLRTISSIRQIHKIRPFVNFKHSLKKKRSFFCKIHQLFWEDSLCTCLENVANSKFSIAETWVFWSPDLTNDHCYIAVVVSQINCSFVWLTFFRLLC